MKRREIPDKVNLLYIEDDEYIASLISKQLNSSSDTFINITLKKTLGEAITFLENECTIDGECLIDVVLLDLSLPNSKGVNTFLKVKEAVGFIPIVIISGYEDIACKCVALGAQDYLVKGDVTSALLIRSVKYAIQRSRLERKIKNVITTSPIGYHMYELIDDKIIFVGYNPAAEIILNVDHKQFLNKEITKAFPNLPDEILKDYRNTIEKGIPIKSVIIPYKDSKIQYGHYRINAYRCSKNQMAVTFEDITDSVLKDKALKNSEKRYRELVEVTGAGMYGIDFETGRFTYVNDVFCKKTGYTREELFNMKPEDLLTEEGINLLIERTVALKEGEYIEDTAEYELVRKDGSTSWMLVTSQFIEDREKNIIGVNVVAIDITEKKQIQKVLKEKELKIYSDLETKIKSWKDELEIKNNIKNNKLKMIDAELSSLNKKIEVI